MDNHFLYRRLPVVGKEVFRLGLAVNYGVSEPEITQALTEMGMNYIFWTTRMKKATPAVKAALKQDRGHYVIATGPTTAWWASNLARYVDKALLTLDTDYIDILQMFWVGAAAIWNPANVAALVRLRETGKVKAIGISTHNRILAGRLAVDSPLDLLMIRYNAVHTGAEQDVFPHLIPDRRILVSYTATCWGKLLKPRKNWEEELPTAGDCYRFCLSSPHVDVTLSGPANIRQAAENIAAIRKGPLDPERMAWMRRFGKRVHG